MTGLARIAAFGIRPSQFCPYRDQLLQYVPNDKKEYWHMRVSRNYNRNHRAEYISTCHGLIAATNLTPTADFLDRDFLGVEGGRGINNLGTSDQADQGRSFLSGWRLREIPGVIVRICRRRIKIRVRANGQEKLVDVDPEAVISAEQIRDRANTV